MREAADTGAGALSLPSLGSDGRREERDENGFASAGSAAADDARGGSTSGAADDECRETAAGGPPASAPETGPEGSAASSALPEDAGALDSAEGGDRNNGGGVADSSLENDPESGLGKRDGPGGADGLRRASDGSEPALCGFMPQDAAATDSVLRRALHPALAPPAIPRLDEEREVSGVSRTALDRCRFVRGDDGGDRGQAGGARARGDSGVDRGARAAAAADVVADALPPAMVLEKCLLAPLREHCRRTSSECVRVFVEDLGLDRIAGDPSAESFGSR